MCPKVDRILSNLKKQAKACFFNPEQSEGSLQDRGGVAFFSIRMITKIISFFQLKIIEFKNIPTKDLITLFFSGAVVFLALLQWRIKQRELLTKELRTACRNFFDISLSNWLKQLSEIINLDGFYGKQICFSVEENKFYFETDKHACPNLLKEIPPELKKHTPRELKNEFISLNKRVMEFNAHLEQLRKKIEDLANRCLKEIDNDITVLTSIMARKLDEYKWVIVEFFLDSLFAGYDIAKIEQKRKSIDNNYLHFFFSEEAEEFINKIAKNEVAIISQHKDLIKEAERLQNLLKEKRQVFSVKYYIPIKELNSSF